MVCKMKLVIDSNLLMAALIKDSIVRRIIISNKFVLIAPEYLFDEITKYSGVISDKADISLQDLQIFVGILLENIHLVKAQNYMDKINEAKEIMNEDIKDVPYVACYLAMHADGIWSEDAHFDNKKELRVFKSKDIIKLFRN